MFFLNSFQYAFHVTGALSYLNALKVLHRDIKPENILICDGIAKLADFGFCVHSPQFSRTTMCGTPGYLAPEILNGVIYYF